MNSARIQALKTATLLFKNSPKDQEEFVKSVFSGATTKPALIWTKAMPASPPFPLLRETTWQPNFVSIVEKQQKAGSHPLHAEGSYYCLDFSSIFSASAMLETSKKPLVILDLCAAPGGKGIFSWKALEPELLISNEVIGKRTGSLISNLKRCQVGPSQVTQLDPAHFAHNAKNSFDMVLVDAPCSGQSLIGKGIEVPGAFNPLVIKMNAQRQKRILANAAEAVMPGGYLHYMTCTFSPQENEDVISWLLKKRPDFKAMSVPHLEVAKSNLVDFPCYRLLPRENLGVGGFTCLLHKDGNISDREYSYESLHTIWSSK